MGRGQLKASLKRLNRVASGVKKKAVNGFFTLEDKTQRGWLAACNLCMEPRSIVFLLLARKIKHVLQESVELVAALKLFFRFLNYSMAHTTPKLVLKMTNGMDKMSV